MNLAWSEALDRYAASIENKPPLKLDPVLYELLAEDRAEAPFDAPKKAAGKPRRQDVTTASPEEGGCRRCYSLMRPPHTKLADYPNTVNRGAHGMCTSCYQFIKRNGLSFIGGDA
ncbi:hypothetical protein NWP13_23790 [Rhodococcus pyridinivorans]|nr:hypothetical protein [Rhodococcus pyridinivorans]